MTALKWGLIVACLAAVGMTRSGIPWRFALVPGAQGKLGQTACVIVTSQREIDTSIKPSNLANVPIGGLVDFAMDKVIDIGVDAYSKARVEKFARDLREAMRDFVFENVAGESFSARFKSNRSLTITDVATSLDTTKAAYERLVTESRGEAVLLVFMQYYLDPRFTQIVVTADVDVCAKSDALVALGKTDKFGKTKIPVLYSTQFQSEWPLPAEARPAEKTRESYAAAWATDHGRPVRNVLSYACQEIAAMLEWDLAQPASKKLYGYGSRENIRVYDFRTSQAFDGAPVRKDDGRLWVIAPEGFLYGRSL